MSRLPVGDLAGPALDLLDLALGLHLLVADDRADAVLHLAHDLLDRAFDALVGLGGLLLGLPLDLLHLAFGFHLLVADDPADGLLDLAAELLGRTFSTIPYIHIRWHVGPPQEHPCLAHTR